MERGVVVEFDFVALNGAEILFETAKRFLKNLDGIGFDETLEARYLSGVGYQDGLARLFQVVRTKKTAAKAARDLAAAFALRVTAAVPSTLGPSFRNFIKALVEKGVRVVIATRADLEVVKPLFSFVPGGRIAFYPEASDAYGTCRWDSWRRAGHKAGLNRASTVAVAGSGFGVKSALSAGMGVVAVTNAHVAYQDFGGADDVVSELSGKTARSVLKALRI